MDTDDSTSSSPPKKISKNANSNGKSKSASPPPSPRKCRKAAERDCCDGVVGRARHGTAGGCGNSKNDEDGDDEINRHRQRNPRPLVTIKVDVAMTDEVKEVVKGARPNARAETSAEVLKRAISPPTAVNKIAVEKGTLNIIIIIVILNRYKNHKQYFKIFFHDDL